MKIQFADLEHKVFFNRVRLADGCGNDPYRLSLFYLLGSCETIRQNFKTIYNPEKKIVDVESVFCGWQTGTTVRLTRLALNLYNGWYGYDYETKKQIEDADLYTPYELFCHELAEYALIAVAIRYERYTGLEYE